MWRLKSVLFSSVLMACLLVETPSQKPTIYNLADLQKCHHTNTQQLDLRWVSKDYFSRHSDLRQRENRFLGLTSVWKPVFMPA